MPKHHLTLSENDIAKIINGGEVHFESKGEIYIVRQCYAKDMMKDVLIRNNRVMNTASGTFEYY